MTVLTVNVGGKTYTTSRITTGLSREAMRITEESLKHANFAKSGSETTDPESFALDLPQRTLALSDRTLNLIVRAFGYSFGIDELEDSLTNLEVNQLVNDITRGVQGIASKN